MGVPTSLWTGTPWGGYAQDVINLLDHLKLQKAVLVGWSMGAFVAWELLKRFGTDRVAGLVVVDESASDFSWPEWGYGVVDALGLSTFHEGIQDAQAEVAQEFAPEMFASLPDQETLQWMVDEMCKLPPAVASSILFAQTLVDYREFLTTLKVPTLLCFGRDEQLVPVAAGEDLATRIKDSKLLVFENSSHCPFLEEPDRFNLVVSQFAGGLDV